MSYNGQHALSKDDLLIKNLPPPKRDFQEANPPKTLDELYSRYDPSVGIGIAIALGSLLTYLLAQVAVRYVCKNAKRYLQRSKTFARYFPEEKLPPLHVVKQLAIDQGIDIPEDLLLKLSCSDSSHHQTNTESLSNKRSSTKTTILSTSTTVTPKSPEDIFFGKLPCQSVKETEYFLRNSNAPGVIKVNIIGATPSITPNPCHKPNYPPPPYERFASTSSAQESCCVDAEHFTPNLPGPSSSAVDYPNVVVTTATIENLPLLNEDLINNSSNLNTTNVPSCSKYCVSSKTETEKETFNRSSCLLTNETIV